VYAGLGYRVGQEYANTRLWEAALRGNHTSLPDLVRRGTRFTCFTSTKVQILTPAAQERMCMRATRRDADGACWYSVYLLY
jgi:hypothetical protein